MIHSTFEATTTVRRPEIEITGRLLVLTILAELAESGFVFSQTAEYALRAVLYLAQHPHQGPIGNKVIADGTQVPASYLSKILHDLTEAEILSSRRGVGGGFRLTRRPAELTVLEVIRSVDPIKRITGCPLALPSHCDQLCPMHARMDASLAQVEKTLGESTIEEMLFDPTRPVPLVDQFDCKERTMAVEQV